MEIRADSVEARLTRVRIAGVPELVDVTASAGGVTLRLGPDGTALEAQIQLAVAVTQEAANEALGAVSGGRLSALAVAFEQGLVRVTGRYGLAALLTVSFAVEGQLAIEAGTRVRFVADRVRVVGAPLPGALASQVGERISARLSELLDAGRLPVPVLLTSLAVEAGRVVFQATCQVCGAVPVCGVSA